MNFQKIPPVEVSKHLLELAFRRARIKGKQKNLQGNWLQIIRKKESLKLDIVKEVISQRLEKTRNSFPSTNDLSSFYLKLMQLTLDYPMYKKSLGAVQWALRKVYSLHRMYVSKVNKTKDRESIKDLTKQFYGRISSILKQVDVNFAYLETARKIMRSYPDIKDMFTICIYGFPNVGKTTFLNKLTGTKGKVAAYAFTTKTINAGYFTFKTNKVQVLDVPGTLSRTDKMNIIEAQADLVVTELANVIIYVFDISGYSGFSEKQQEQLFTKIKKEKNVIVHLSKQDLLDKETIAEFKHKHLSEEQIKEKIEKLAQKYEDVKREKEETEKEEIIEK
ncbi:GTP-binding protein [Candidatus Woesearchaeota archaeon]|jgi:nucleolar GTP-binding protein|nr:GTP-binding protein [Candidatus Woesearchaeota archaeon]MBT5397453.1 GTP-binding protein [Candidatus Woesearchaeota archaeon]MBT5924930.1 GTP-binding protein [Candidatus Woesearchaeota archaeon]MBT6367974.1 GTP-binding protein [Candidatus Woesearchaeota archaeon]MBT7763198.1 GTP-binding protein [Candidatus Woesearchaeota archaeon]